MNLTVTGNAEQLIRKVGIAAAARVAADRVAVVEIAREFTRHVADHAPKDTNRFVRSIVQAAQDVGVKGIPLPAIKASSRYQKYLVALVAQVESNVYQRKWWERRAYAWYESKGRTRDKYYQKILSQIRKYQRWEIRSREELEKAKGNEALIFLDEHGAINRLNRSEKSRNISTVRVKVYGGDGRIVVLGGTVGAVLVSREPHANFVEKRFGTVAAAKAHVRGASMPGLTSQYAKQVRTAMGLRAAAGAA